LCVLLGLSEEAPRFIIRFLDDKFELAGGADGRDLFWGWDRGRGHGIVVVEYLLVHLYLSLEEQRISSKEAAGYIVCMISKGLREEGLQRRLTEAIENRTWRRLHESKEASVMRLFSFLLFLLKRQRCSGQGSINFL
jgi:hypothetical protein